MVTTREISQMAVSLLSAFIAVEKQRVLPVLHGCLTSCTCCSVLGSWTLNNDDGDYDEDTFQVSSKFSLRNISRMKHLFLFLQVWLVTVHCRWSHESRQDQVALLISLQSCQQYLKFPLKVGCCWINFKFCLQSKYVTQHLHMRQCVVSLSSSSPFNVRDRDITHKYETSCVVCVG